MTKNFIIGVAALLGSISNSMAAITTYETRNIDQAINSSDYKGSWFAQSSTITVQNLADFNGSVVPGGVQGGFSALTVSFNTPASGNQWGFRFAPDAGLGGEIYLDDQLLARDSSDLWWGADWNNTTEILSASGLSVGSGNHTFKAYWAEDCCNGGQGLQYTTDGFNWASISDLPSPAAVPLPSVAWLFVSGFLGVLGLGRKREA
jgi:hypothetical protein